MKHILLLPLIWLSYQDLKTKTVNLISLLVFFACAIVLGSNWMSAALMLIITSILFITTKGIAIADILIISATASLIPLENTGYFLIFIGFSAAIAGNYFGKKIPLVPFITFGLLGCLILERWLL